MMRHDFNTPYTHIVRINVHDTIFALKNENKQDEFILMVITSQLKYAQHFPNLPKFVIVHNKYSSKANSIKGVLAAQNIRKKLHGH